MSQPKSLKKQPGGRGIKPYETGAPLVAARGQPLLPLMPLERVARALPNHVAIVHDRLRSTYRQFNVGVARPANIRHRLRAREQ